jgi:hypothetical protein
MLTGLLTGIAAGAVFLTGARRPPDASLVDTTERGRRCTYVPPTTVHVS